MSNSNPKTIERTVSGTVSLSAASSIAEEFPKQGRRSVLLDFYRAEPELLKNNDLNFQIQRIVGIIDGWQLKHEPESQELKVRYFRAIERAKTFHSRLKEYIEEEVLGNRAGQHKSVINKLLKQVYVFQLNYMLASEEVLSASEYRQIEKALSMQSSKIHKLADDLLTGCEDHQIRLLINELKSTPQKIRNLRELRILLDKDIEIRSGDRLGGIVILKCDAAKVFALVMDEGQHMHERTFNLDDFRSSIIAGDYHISRGGHMSYISIGDEPGSCLKNRVPVMMRAYTSEQLAFECGRVIGIVEYPDLHEYDLKLLWYSHDGSASIKALPERDLKHYKTSEVFTARGYDILETILSANIFSSLRNLEHYSRRHPDFKLKGDQGFEFYQNLKAAEYPIALHVIGKEETLLESGILDNLRSKVAFYSSTVSTALPVYTAEFVDYHFGKSLILVQHSSMNPELLKQLSDLKKEGFEVAVLLANSAVSSLGLYKDAGFKLIQTQDAKLCRRKIYLLVRQLSTQARASYSNKVCVKNSECLSQNLLSALDSLAESKPSQALSKMPELLLALQRGLSSSVADADYFELLDLKGEKQTTDGHTRIRKYWTRDDLLELSTKLKKSALPADHPAVALRGLTSRYLLGLRELESLLQKGAIFITLEDEQNDIQGLVISYPPEVVEKLYKNLSKDLGRPKEVAYIYWLWIDPDSNLSASYGKLLNSLIAQQLKYGSTFIFARALERNIQSIRAAMSVLGFDILESDFLIEGEPSVGLGFDLKISTNEKVLNARQILNTALGVFAFGNKAEKYSNSPDLYQRRLLETLDFIQAEYDFISVCRDINVLKDKNPRYKSILKLQDNALETLEKLEQYIDADLYSKAYELILLLILDDQREQAIIDLNVLITNSIPESRAELRKKFNQIYAYVRTQEIFADREFREWSSDLFVEERGKTLPIFPTITIPEIISRYAVLSEEVKEYLRRRYGDSLALKTSWSNNDDVVRIAEIISVKAGWIESELERINAFIWVDNVTYNNLPDFERNYYLSINKFLNWYNEAARSGNLDYELGLYAEAFFRAFFLGEG